MFFGVCVQHAILVAEHFKLHPDVWSILLGEEGGQLGLDIRLLFEKTLDGGIQGRVIRGRGEEWRGQLRCRDRARPGAGTGSMAGPGAG